MFSEVEEDPELLESLRNLRKFVDGLEPAPKPAPPQAAVPEADLSEEQKRLAYIGKLVAADTSIEDAKKAQAPVDRSIMGAVRQSFDQPLEGIGDTLQLFGAETLGGMLKGMVDAPVNYESASDRFIHPQPGDTTVGGFGIGSLPRAVVEQAGQLAGSVLSRVAGGAAGAAIGGALGAPAAGAGAAPGAITGGAVGAFAGPFLFGALQIAGPTALERAQKNGRSKANLEDISWGLATAAASGALDSLGTNLPGGKSVIGSVLSKYFPKAGTLLESMAKKPVQNAALDMLGEGLTETPQSIIEQFGESVNTPGGAQVDFKQALGEGLIGAGTGLAHSLGHSAYEKWKKNQDALQGVQEDLVQNGAVQTAEELAKIQEQRLAEALAQADAVLAEDEKAPGDPPSGATDVFPVNAPKPPAPPAGPAATPAPPTASVTPPETAPPEPVTPEVVTPEVVTPEPVTPEVVTPEVVTPEVVTPEVVTPEPVTPEPVAPEPVAPEPAPTEVAPTDVVTPEVVTPQPKPPKPPKPLSKKAQLAEERAAKKVEAEREKELVAAGRAYAKKELIEEVLDSGRIPHVSVVQRRTGDKNFNAELKRLFAETFPAEQPGPNEVLTSGEGAKTAKHLKWVDRDTKLPVVRNTETGQTRNLFANNLDITAMQVDMGLDVYVPKGVTPHRRIKINSENKVVAVDHPRYGWVSGRGEMADARAVDPEFLENQIAATGGEDVKLSYFGQKAATQLADLDQQVRKLPLSDETRNEFKIAEDAALTFIYKKRLDGFDEKLRDEVLSAAGTKFSIDIREALIAEGRLPKGYGGYANKALADTISEAHRKLQKRPGRKHESFDDRIETDWADDSAEINEEVAQEIDEKLAEARQGSQLEAAANEDLGEGSGPSGGVAGSPSVAPDAESKPLRQRMLDVLDDGPKAVKKAFLEEVRGLASLTPYQQIKEGVRAEDTVVAEDVEDWTDQDFTEWGAKINPHLKEPLYSKKTAEAIKEQTPEVAKGIIGKLTEMMRRLAPGVKFRIVRSNQVGQIPENVLASAKSKVAALKMPAELVSSAELWVARNESTVDWNKVKTAEQLWELVRERFTEATNPERLTYKVNREDETEYKNFIKWAAAAASHEPKFEALYRRFDDTKSDADWQALLDFATARKVENAREWLQHFEDTDSDFFDLFWRATAWEIPEKALLGDRNRGLGDTLHLHQVALADLRQQFLRSPHGSPADAYGRLVRQYVLASLKTKEPGVAKGSVWAYIPSRSEDPLNFEANVQKLKDMSCVTWCTRSYNAEPYLKDGGVWVLSSKSGSSLLAVRLEEEGGGRLAEIRDPNNIPKIEGRYWPELEPFLTAHPEIKSSLWIQFQAEEDQIPPSMVEKYLAHPDPAVRLPFEMAAARRTDTAPEILSQYTRHEDYRVVERAAGNTSTPPEDLSALRSHEDIWVVEAVAKNTSTPPEDLSALRSLDDVLIVRAVAENTSTPPEDLSALRSHEDFHVVKAVAENTSTPPEDLSALISHEDFAIVEAVAGNTSTLPEDLSALRSHEDFLVVKAVANNTSTPPEDLNALGAHKSWVIVNDVAKNTSTPTEALYELLENEDEEIRENAQENLRNRQQRLESLSVDGVEAYYDKAADEVVFVADNIDEERAGKLVYHELSHRNLALLEQTLGGRLELGRILETARPQLMAHLPELLASTGHKDLRALMQDYGYGATLEGRAAVLNELMARYAERLDGRTKPSWWRELLSKVRVWLAKHFGVALDEDALEYWLAGNMERFASTPSGARSEERAYSKRAPVNGRTRQQSMARRAAAKLRRYGGPVEFQRDQFKPSEALSRASLAMDPKMREILRETTYLPGNKADDLEAANRFIFSHNTLEDAILALDAANSQPFTPGRLSEEQAWLARGIIAGKLNKMALAMDVAPNSIGKRLLSKHYKNLAVDQIHKVQKELMKAGSFLSRVGRGMADLYFPEAVIRDLVDPVRKTQEEVLSKDDDVQAVVDAIDTSSEPAAEKAVAVAKPLFDRLRPAATETPGVDEMQPVFDFFEGLMGEGTMKAYWNPATGEWTEGKLVDAIADRLVKLTKASMAKAKAAKVPRPVIELLEKQIRSEVEARLKPLFRSKEFIGPKAGPVQQLLKEIDNVDLVERAFNSSKEALLARGDLSPEERRAIEQAKFEGADLKAAQAVIRKAINLREIVQGHLADRNASLETLTQTILENAQISEAKASAVAKALKTAFDIEAERVVRARLDALQKERKPSRTKPIHASERLFALSNLGAFDTAEVYNAIAKANPHYKLPVYDEQFVKSVKQEADRIQTMPAGSDAKNAATVNLLSRVAHAHARNLRGFKKIMYYIGDVGPAVWQAGVLSGPPTALVNAIGTAMIVQYKAYSQAYGNYRAARKMGRNNAEASQFFKDVSKGWLDSVGATRSGPSTAWMDAKQAIKTGSTRFKNATRSELSILENYSLPHKWVGRFMLMADAYNTATADEINQRQALRFAMMTQGKNAAEIMQAMNEAFHPEASSMAQIEQQILEETKAGHLGSGKELELNTQIRRTELLEQRRFTATPEIREIAREESEKWTLNGDPKGYAGLIFDGMFGRLNRETKVTKYFLSFMKTNANLLNLALDFSPLGLLHAYNKSPGINLSKKYRLERIDRSTPQGEAKHQTLFIQGMLGTLALGALVLKGLLDEEEGEDPWFAVYGPGPKTAMERQQLREGSDWEPNTVKIGDLKLRYTDFPVLNLLLGAYGTLSDQARFDKKLSDKDVVERASLWALGMANIVFERQMLSGLSNLFKIIQNPDSRGIHAVKQLTSGVAGGFTNPQAMKWMRNTLWLGEDLKAPVLDQGSTAGWAASMVPFSAGYDSPALNVLGEPIKEYFWYPTTRRFFTLSEHTHPILGPVVSNGLMLESPSKMTQIQVGGIKQAVGRSETAWRRFVELRGEEIKKRVPSSFLSRLSTMKRELAQDQLNEVTKTARIAAVTRLEKELKSGATEF